MNTKDNKSPEVETKQSAQSELAEAVKTALSEALPLATAMAAQAVANANRPVEAPAPQGQFLKQAQGKCPECGQLSRACKGEHRMACVFPQDEEAAEWFTGVQINGVRYLSNGLGHFVSVPKDSNVEYLVAAWENNERIQRRGRKARHNSGSIGSTNNFQAFNGPGFGEGTK